MVVAVKDPEMEAAQIIAEAELDNLDQETVKKVGRWIKRHYLGAGLRPLARMLMTRSE